MKKFHEFINEEHHGYDVFHKGKHIDTVFYSHHEDPASVKKSLVNHDGYHPDITVRHDSKRPKGLRVRHIKEATTGLKPLTQYTYVPSRGHFVGGKKGDAAFQKHQTEYMKRKKLTPVKEDMQLDELKKSTLKSYLDKAYPNAHALQHDANYGPKKETRRKLNNRQGGIKRAWMKGSTASIGMTEEAVQPLNELKNDTLKSYIKKSYGDIGHQSGMIGHLKVKKYKSSLLQKSSADQLKFHTRKEKNRGQGIDRAVTQLTKEGVAQLDETFMGTYTRNENANRHTANIVHLAKHFGDEADKAQAKFYAAELKKHGHNLHHEAQYKMHEKLWPKAMAAHHRGALGGTYYESTENPAQTPSVPKYQVGSTVKPKIGPHSGIKHTVIHVHPDGSYNIKPDVHASLNKYRQGATRAQQKDLE